MGLWKFRTREYVENIDTPHAPPLTAAAPWLTENRRVALGYRVMWWASLVWLVVLVLGGISDGSLREDFFSSDHLYIPALLDDLTRRGGSLHDWRLTPAPYFFPDLPLYAVWRLLRVNLEWAQYLGGISQFILVLWASRASIEAVLGVNALAAPIAGPVFVLALVLQLCGAFELLQPLFMLSNHGGAALSTLVTLALVLRGHGSNTQGARKRERRGWSLVTLGFAFASGWSDPLFAASCGVPLGMFGVCWLALRQRRGPRPESPINPFTLLGVAALSVSGAEAARVMQHLLSDLRLESGPALSASSWSRLIADLFGPARGELAVFSLGWLLALWTLWNLRGRAHWAKLRFLALFQLTSSVCTFAAVVWAGNYVDVATLRYVLVPFTTSFVLFAALLASALGSMLVQSWGLRFPRALSLGVAIGLLGTFGWQRASLLGGQYHSNDRATARCVEAVARNNATDVVLAGYWFAKPLMLFSQHHLKVLQMVPDMNKPYWWINSRNWYRGAHEFGVIATNGLDANGIRKTFGKPREISHCGDVELFVYVGKQRQHLQQAMQDRFEQFVHAEL